jgi:hypothetical protein
LLKENLSLWKEEEEGGDKNEIEDLWTIWDKIFSIRCP